MDTSQINKYFLIEMQNVLRISYIARDKVVFHPWLSERASERVSKRAPHIYFNGILLRQLATMQIHCSKNCSVSLQTAKFNNIQFDDGVCAACALVAFPWPI